MNLIPQKIVILFASTLIMYAGAAAPVPKKEDTNKEKSIEKQALNTTHKTIIGSVEKVRVLPGNVVLEARIDTGATTSSIGVDSYRIFREDGKKWVEIDLDGQLFKHKVVKFIHIKQHGNESKKRPVIKLRLIIGEVSETVNVTLADRSNFEYQLLIGRNMLYDHFVVDVSLKHATTPKEYEVE